MVPSAFVPTFSIKQELGQTGDNALELAPVRVVSHPKFLIQEAWVEPENLHF